MDYSVGNKKMFLQQQNVMASVMSSFNWSASPIGRIEDWTQSLQTTLSIVLSATVPMLLVWGDSRTCFYNDQYAKLFGEAERQFSLLGKSCGEITDPSWTTIKSIVDRVMEDGVAIYQAEFIALNEAYWTVHFNAISGEGNAITGVLIRFIETTIKPTEQLLAKSALVESEERFSSIFNQTSVGIAQTEMNGRFILVNDRFCSIVGRSKQELLTLSLHEITHPHDLQENIGLLEDAIHKGTPFNLEKRYVKPDETHVWVNISVSTVKDIDGNPKYILGVCHDITERKKVEDALRESEQRFRIMADASPTMIWVMNANGIMNYINKVAVAYLGFEVDDPENFDWSSILHPDDFEQSSTAIATAIQNRMQYKHEHRLRKHTGEFRWVLSQGAPSYAPNGELLGYIGSAIDIHDRKRMEEELRYQGELMKTITDNATDALFMMDDRGVCTFLNPAAENMFGYSLQEIQDKPLHDYVHYLRPDGSYYAIHDCPVGVAVFGMQELKNHEDLFIRKDGTFVPVKCSAKRIVQDGKLKGVLLEVRDVTEEKLAASALHESEERFRLMADNISQLAWMANENGDIFWYNKRWFDFTGADANNESSLDYKQFHHPEFVEAVVQRFTASIREGLEWEDTFPLLSKEGEYRWFLSRAIPIRDANGRVMRWFGTNTDITERKQAEEAIKVMADNLERLVHHRTYELHRSNEDLQQFAHVASHDLKEPLRKIRTFSNRLEEEFAYTLHEDAKLYLAKIQSATERMNAMIEGVLNYSTTNASYQRVTKVNLSEIINDIQIDLELVIEQKKAIIEVVDLPVIEGAEVLLYQLFYNLINNSLKFAKRTVPPQITIRGAITNKHLQEQAEITITDNGIGFEQEYADRIFNTFTRLNSKDKFEGTGLGLSLCKKITERHEGSIQAFGQENIGATFIITLPVKQSKKTI